MDNEYENGDRAGDRNASGTDTDPREPVVVAEQPACPVEEAPQKQPVDWEGSFAGSGNPTPSSGENVWKGPQGDGWNSQQGRQQSSSDNNPGQSSSRGQSSSGADQTGAQNTQGGRPGQTGNGPAYQPAPPVYEAGSQGRGGQNGRQGGNYQYQTQYQTPPPDKNNMSIASLVLGILSLVSCCCTWIGIAFGVLGIIFALMSKTDGQMDGQAKTGLILSIIGIVLDVLIIILFVALQVFSMLPDLGILN